MSGHSSSLVVRTLLAATSLPMYLWQRYKAIIGAALGWSFIGLFLKMIHYDIVPMMSIRSAPYIPLGLLVINATRCKRYRKYRSAWRLTWGQHFMLTCKHVYRWRNRGHLLCAAFSCGSIVCMSFALRYSVGGFATFINSASLFLVLILSGPMLNHWPNKKEVLVVCLGFSGICVLAYAGWKQGDFFGTMLGAASALFITAALVIQKKRACGRRGTEGLESWTLASTICAVGLSPWVIMSGLPSLYELVLIGVLAIFATFVSDVLYVKAISGVNGIPLLHALVISRIAPTLTPVWICWRLGEMPSRLAIIGAVIVILAVGLLACVQRGVESRLAVEAA